MNDEIQKQTTEGITFRIPSKSISQLLEESKKKQVSLKYASNIQSGILNYFDLVLECHENWGLYYLLG